MIFAADASDKDFVDLDVEVWHWGLLIGLIVVMLAIDLYRHRDNHEPTAGSAFRETMAWVACGLAFGGLVAYLFGGEAFGEYLAGYLVEKSLSIDNVFVWALIFSTMKIPLKYQHRVLFWGIFGALVLRAIFILAGTALISRFVWLLVLFGVFLIFTGFKVLRHRDDEGENTNAKGAALLKRLVPVTDELDGDKFFTVPKVRKTVGEGLAGPDGEPAAGSPEPASFSSRKPLLYNGAKAATPLFSALVVVEFTDVIFAVDSVPAVLAVSRETFLVFASNAFAILGLRAMYFLLADAKDRFHYLSHGLGAILIFVGIKMTISPFTHLDTFLSLGIIVTLLALAIGFSELRNRRQEAEAEDTVSV